MVKKIKVDYEKKIMERQSLNLKKVRDSIGSAGMQTKLTNFAERYNLNKSFVEQRVIDDVLFGAQFSISPGRQSYHEEIAFDYIRSLDRLNKSIRLPASGPDAKYVTKDGVVSGKPGKLKSRSKSIDFELRVSDKTIYVSHKYTKDDGGAQDNQFNDVKMFIEEVKSMVVNKGSSQCRDIFMVIVDGPYYKRSGRIKELNNISSGFVKVLTIEDLEAFLEDDIVNSVVEGRQDYSSQPPNVM